MIIQINYGDVQASDAIATCVNDNVTKHLGHLAEKITRVEVHLRDDNSSTKSAHNDKRCTIEARPAGRKPLAVEHAGDDLYKVINQAAAKLARAVKNDLDRSAAK